MKLLRKIIPCVLVVTLLLLTLTACIDGDAAKGTIADFLKAIEEENYDAAKTYLHPERPSDLKTFFDNVEEQEGVDFQSGIEILRYTGVKSSAHDTTVGGATYETTLKANIGDKKATLTVELVDNDNGYGIYNFDIDF